MVWNGMVWKGMRCRNVSSICLLLLLLLLLFFLLFFFLFLLFLLFFLFLLCLLLLLLLLSFLLNLFFFPSRHTYSLFQCSTSVLRFPFCAFFSLLFVPCFPSFLFYIPGLTHVYGFLTTFSSPKTFYPSLHHSLRFPSLVIFLLYPLE